MFSNITWTQYFLVLALTMGAYYAIIISLYFRQGLSSLVRTSNLLPQRYNRTDQDDRPDYDGLAKMVVDLKCILESAGGAEKGAILSLLKQRLVTYPGLQLPAFRVAIFQYIIRNTSAVCGFSVTEKELEALITSPSPAGAVLLTGLLVISTLTVFGQDGNAGIIKATTEVKRYFDTAQKLLYAVGGIAGLVGAIKVYNKWSAGEPDTAKVASAWFSACIFLVVVATVLKAFFSL